jgi:amino acid transporter
VQISTLLILVVAANTSFAGFPTLVAILAKDGYLPRQLTNLGDRLVYSNGMLLLASATAILIIVFRAESHALIPLFAVGVFLAFTLSQAGMVSALV